MTARDQQGGEKPSASVVVIDPDTAQRWLDRNTNNRNIRKALVASYARDMAAGEWQLTGDAIRFAADGTLLDGQHRLRAIVESGATIPVFVIRGLSKDTQAVMDIGAKRSAADALRLRGAVGDTKDIAAIARSLLMLETKEKPTLIQVIHYAEAHFEDLIEASRIARMITSGGLHGGSLFGVAFYQLAQIDFEKALDFFSRLATGEELGRGSPILLLRNRFMPGQPGGSARDVTTLRRNLAYIFKAWNDWRAGRKLSFLRAPETMPVPK